MMYDSMFTGVTQKNFEDRVEIFISSTFPTFNNYDAAAREFVWRLENKDLALLAESSDSYEFDEKYGIMSEISERTGINFVGDEWERMYDNAIQILKGGAKL